MGWNRMGWNRMGWDGIGWDGIGWDGIGWDGIGWDDVRQLRFSGFEEAEEFNYEINGWDTGRHHLIISYQN